MGSVEPRFAMTLRRDLGEGIFRASCLYFVGSEAGWGAYEEGQSAGGTAGVMAIVRYVCSCSSACVYLFGVSAVQWARARLCLGLGCPMPRMAAWSCCFLIDSRDLITEVGKGWPGAEDALWLFSPPPPLSLYSFSSPRLPFLRSQRSESARWCLCQRAATAGLHPAEDRRASSQRGPAVRHFPNSAGDPPGAAPLAAPAALHFQRPLFISYCKRC